MLLNKKTRIMSHINTNETIFGKGWPIEMKSQLNGERGQSCEDLEKDVSGEGIGYCKCPHTGLIWACLGLDSTSTGLL